MNEYSEKIHYERHLNHMNSNKKINEDEQIPHKFDMLLDKHEDVSNLQSLIQSSATLTFVSNEECKKNLAQLARNIRLIIFEYSGNPEKRCRDINYWMNDKIKTCNEKHQVNISTEAKIVFNDIKWKKGDEYDIVCKREVDPYKSKSVEIMKKLDDYCEIRDNNRCNILKDKNECIKYNSYVNRKKQYFSDEKKKICDTSDCSRNNYTIDANCTLNNMEDTFREINCDCLYKKDELQKPDHIIKGRSPLEIGFFIIVSLILFYLFILFLEKVK
ncbi:hypothetical protein PVMG_04884 [Plasmodium vivax Mauritania I]|uniref:PIR Superfamily Protein n=1 Tax=Plasmodium vivax Mauritania I TaxID=1035515 RepID=A0A0J9T8Z3_PLAVI|nr:hypothetical protein PVMG_04884 [Plasmodium vivax Mauritania I]